MLYHIILYICISITHKNTHKMKHFNDFETLLLELESKIKIENGLIISDAERHTITRKVNGSWELISLSNYKNSEDVILVETKEFTFTISRWDNFLTLGNQITIGTQK